MKSIACVIGSLAVFGQVQGHGGVYNYTIGKTSYAGHYPWLLEDQQPESIQRRWWPDPIQDVNHPYLSCNRGNPLAKKLPTLHAPIEAGTNITAHYLPPKCPPDFNQPETALPYKNEPNPPLICSGSEYSWPHASGPLITYMAACNGPCDQFDPSFSPVWFKIYENGFTPGKDCWVVDGEEHCLERDIGGTGFAQYLLRQGWSVQIPKNLKPGNYLIRHEVIMIELMPPQFYPECAQLTVTGSGDKFPSEDYLVSFPGAYSLEDPGLAICGDIYSPKGHSTRNYTVPGPKVWTGDE